MPVLGQRALVRYGTEMIETSHRRIPFHNVDIPLTSRRTRVHTCRAVDAADRRQIFSRHPRLATGSGRW